MIHPRQAAMAALALTLSGALHAAGFIRLPDQPGVALQAGGAETIPRLGESFADMAQGAALAAPLPDPVTPRTMPATPPVEPAASVPPVQAGRVPMVAALPSTSDPQTAPLAPVRPSATGAPQQEALAPLPEAEMAAPAQSLRPQTRPDRPAPDRVARQPTRATPQPPGNANRNATRGANAGQERNATAATAQSPQAAAQGDAGTAASATYGRAVLTQISRTRKARAPSRGRTIVAFSIAEGGALASVQVLKSSGSPALDQVALDHIRRAAPFPKPPAGAQRQFSFEFVGRG